MARTTAPKPEKKKRTIKETLLKKIKARNSLSSIPTISNWGGMMIDPPSTCPHRFTAPDGGIWADRAVCFSVCADKCERYKWINKASNKQKAIEWKNCGVISFSFGEYNHENV